MGFCFIFCLVLFAIQLMTYSYVQGNDVLSLLLKCIKKVLMYGRFSIARFLILNSYMNFQMGMC